MRPVEHTLLRGLDRGQREAVLSTTHEFECDEGVRLFSEGGPADACWLIHAGQVALDTTVPGRGQVVVETLGPGDVLGWSWMIPPYRWHFGAVVVHGRMHATVFDASRLQQVAARDPAIGYALSRRMLVVMLDRLQSTRARLLDLYDNPAARRS